jgi:lysophospholipase L1-like esterase
MSSWRVRLLEGLLLFAAGVFALGLAEITVRVVSPQPSGGILRPDRYGLTIHWSGMTSYLPEYDQKVSFNSAGMRDREHEVHKAAGVFRILLLGDSFVEALQVPFEASLASLLERTLSERTGRAIEVVSAGVSGWGQDDELRYLTQYGLAYQPDLVLVAMTLHNDINDNLRREWHTLRDGVLVEQPREPMPLLEYEQLKLKSFLASRLQLVQLWRKYRHGVQIAKDTQQLRDHVAEQFEVPTPERIADGVELTGRLLEKIAQITTSNGARMALVLLPIRYQVSNETFAEYARSNDSKTMQIDKPQQMVRQIAVELGIPTIDLLPEFQKWTAQSSAPLFIEWDGHWNEAGHRLATDVVAGELIRSGTVHP